MAILKKLSLLVLVAIIALVQNCHAQTFQINSDNVYYQGKVVCTVMLTDKKCLLRSVLGKDLVEMHYSYTYANDKPAYVIHFLNNDRFSLMAVDGNNFPGSIIQELLKQKLLIGGRVDERLENKFVAEHPLPAKFEDISTIYEYGMN